MTTTTQDQDQCRAEFEAWANGILALAYECEKGRYVDGYSETCFQCWQAARRTQPPACAADDGWQPIETAPKDGLGVLLRSARGRIADGAWIAATSSVGGWAWAYINQEPTHWRPLPKPPTDKGAPDA